MLKETKPEYPDKKDIIRQCPCIMRNQHNHKCVERIDPAHFKYRSFAGLNIKNDRRILPLCRIHHSIQGNIGEKRFFGERLNEARELSDHIHILYLEGYHEEIPEACEQWI